MRRIVSTALFARLIGVCVDRIYKVTVRQIKSISYWFEVKVAYLAFSSTGELRAGVGIRQVLSDTGPETFTLSEIQDLRQTIETNVFETNPKDCEYPWNGELRTQSNQFQWWQSLCQSIEECVYECRNSSQIWLLADFPIRMYWL